MSIEMVTALSNLAAAYREALGLHAVAASGRYTDLTDIPANLGTLATATLGAKGMELLSSSTSALAIDALGGSGGQILDAMIAGMDAAKLTGTIDPARLPVIPSGEQVISSGDFSALTIPQQDAIGKGTLVTTTDGRRWIYTGTGSKTDSSSYIELSDTTPDWSVITNKPAFGSASLSDAVEFATAAQGSKADTALQPLTRAQARTVIVRGDSISDTLWNSRIADFDNGQRGPLFIWDNPAPADLPAGKNAGLQIHIGENPTATPGANDGVAATFVITNENGREQLWGINIVANQTSFGPDGLVRAGEFEIAATWNAQPDPFALGGNPRKTGIEIVSHGGSVVRPTSALWIWANNDDGTKWFSNGVAISRAADTGILFSKYVWDTVEAFQTAAIYDRSNSARFAKIDGNHSVGIFDFTDAGNLGLFAKGPSGTGSEFAFKNGVNFDLSLSLDAGGAAAQAADIHFKDRGTVRWRVGKNGTNDFYVYDPVRARSPIFVAQATGVVTAGDGLVAKARSAYSPSEADQWYVRKISNTQVSLELFGDDGITRGVTLTLTPV